MKKRILSILIVAVLTFSVLVVPTFAWYTNQGSKFVTIDYTTVSAREESSLEMKYALRTLENQTATLLAVAPGKDAGLKPVETNYFSNDQGWTDTEGDWLKNKANANSAISSLYELVGNSTGEVNHIALLEGMLGSKATSGGAEGGGEASDDYFDSNEYGDNRIEIGDNYNSESLHSAHEDIIEEADNRIALLGGFNEDESKMIKLNVTVSPKNPENINDVICANAVRYAAFYYTVTEEGIEGTKTIFSNNAFSYCFEDNGQTTIRTAVEQDSCFEYIKNTLVKVALLVWIDGFEDARAEAGAFDLKAEVVDVANIATSNLSVSTASSAQTWRVVNNVNLRVENVVIPERLYIANGNSTQVVEIGANAFMGNTTIKSVEIPDSIKSICANAFSGCSSLEKVVIGNGVNKIEYNAFKNCTALNQVVFRNPYNWRYKNNSGAQLNIQSRSQAQIVELLTTEGENSNVGNSTSSNWVRVAN